MYYYLDETQLYYIRRGIKEEEKNVKVHDMTNETYWTYWRHSADHTDKVYYNALCKLVEFWRNYFEVSPEFAYAKQKEEREQLEKEGQELLEYARGLENND